MRARTRRLLAFPAAMLAVAVAAFALAVAWPEPQLPVPQPSDFAIRGVAIVDVEAGMLRPGRTVVVRGGRIVSTAADGVATLPPGLAVVDGRGLFAIPGLWDMHAHLYAVAPLLDLPLHVAHGVLNVRDMMGCPVEGDPFIACARDKRRWSAEAVAGLRIAPRLVETSSFMANGPAMAERIGGAPGYFDVATPGQARAFVRHFAGSVDTIKVYDRIPREAYLALSAEARRMGLPLVGHRPHSVDAVEAARHQRSLEHARFLIHDSFDGAPTLRTLAGTPAWREDRRAMVDRHDPARADAILRAMREAGTYYVPTHLTRWADAWADRPEVRNDPHLRYVHPLLRWQWREDLDAILAEDPGAQARRAYRDFHALGLSLTRRAHDAGVHVMVGSDYLVPGVDVHREMAMFVEAGLTPAQALRAATVVPARYAGRSDACGTVEEGKVADLVLLEADPLVDIGNTRRIRAVVFGGALYDRATLDRIDAHVARNARSWRTGAKIVWRFLRHPAAY